jgi:hypothetical protein
MKSVCPIIRGHEIRRRRCQNKSHQLGLTSGTRLFEDVAEMCLGSRERNSEPLGAGL